MRNNNNKVVFFGLATNALNVRNNNNNIFLKQQHPSNELDVQNEWEENTHTHTHTQTKITGTRIGLGRAEGGQKSARNLKKAVDAVRETGETWVESGKNVEKKGLVQ